MSCTHDKKPIPDLYTWKDMFKEMTESQPTDNL